MISRTLLLVNERSSRADIAAVNAVIEKLESAGIVVISEHTRNPEEATMLIRRYGPSIDLITVMGGDGTVNGVLEPVIEAAGALAIIPTGTGNDFARSIGVAGGMDQAIQAIIRNRRKRISVGKVNGHYYLNVAHIGLGGEVMGHLDGSLKSLAGVLAYPIAVAKVLRRNRRFAAKIESDTWSKAFRVMHVAIANGRYFGGGNLVDQSASVFDDKLRLFCLKRFPWWKVFYLAITLRIGRVRYTEHVNYKVDRNFKVTTSKPKDIVVDGEIIGSTPAQFEVLTRLLEVVTGDDYQ